MPLTLRQLTIVAAIVMGLLVGYILLADSSSSGSGPISPPQDSTEELLARGEYLAKAGNCSSCHTAADGQYMAGGVAFQTPFGTLYSTNITPDRETGIGSWSDWDFLNSMRHGLRPDGEHLYPAFPYTAFTKLSNADIAALYAYFQSLPPVNQPAAENELSFPFNKRKLMAFWNFLFLDEGAYEASATHSAEWNRGAYLVEALAHCSACHSPRNLLGAERRSLALSGGEYLDRIPSGEYRPWSAPNLTSTERGLGLWSQQDLEEYLHTARNSFIESFGPMNEVIMNSTRHLQREDIAAMATYLTSTPAVSEKTGSVPDAQTLGRGRTVYNLHCGTCHLPTGEGDAEMAPRLNAGSLVVQSENPASMINAILYSPHTPGPPLLPKWRNPMEEFQYLLDDDEVAAVASFIRHSWQNNAGEVSADQVARQR